MSRICRFNDCKTSAVFGNKGENPKYCVTHKLAGMINIVSKTCIHLDCDKHPTFGNKGEKPKYCAIHKLAGMIDVINKKKL